MNSRDHWQQVYEAKRPEEVSWYQASPTPSLDALEQIGAVPPMSLVDVGAGASTLIDALLDRGWRDLTVVDIAEAAFVASKLRLGERAGQVLWEVADIRSWRPSRTYDVWHDRAAFHFMTSPADRAGYKRGLLGGTHAGSRVILATFATDGPEKCSGLPVRRYDSPTLAGEISDRFSLIADWRETHVTPWGASQAFQWCAFTRK